MTKMLVSMLIVAVAMAAGCSAPTASAPVPTGASLEATVVGPLPVSTSPAGPASPVATRAPDPVRCTDQQDYAGDPRNNAEINSIGASTGACPPPRPVRPGVSCTNQIDYAGDDRSNAEINSIGADTGSCPLPRG